MDEPQSFGDGGVWTSVAGISPQVVRPKVVMASEPSEEATVADLKQAVAKIGELQAKAVEPQTSKIVQSPVNVPNAGF